MTKISAEVINFLDRQGFVVVSTIDSQGTINSSAKGIVKVEEDDKVYLIDLYRANTFSNLRDNPTITITAIDERRFKGYSLKGRAQVVEGKDVDDNIIKEWEDRVVSRISKRLVSDIQEDKKASNHPEARFPKPSILL